MSTNWTKEQSQAINEKGSNILVAAAAGSGKTTVLVERIIRKIIDEQIDIDKILVVTFTNAAASEMRERILTALYKEIDKDPQNTRLRRQIILLNKASICTIDSFCLDVIRNNFFEIGISSNFRIADNTELELLKQEALEDTFEKMYIENDKKFYKLVELYTGYKDDEELKNLVLKIYDYIQSTPFQEEWLNEKIEIFNAKEVKDFTDTIWGKILLKDFRDDILNQINILKNIKSKLEKETELSKYELVISDDIGQLEGFVNINKWDLAYEYSQSIKLKNWPTDKKIVSDLKDECKKSRDKVRERLNKLIEKTFVYDTKEAISDIKEMYPILENLKYVTLQFAENFKEKKSTKNVMDFSDIEHYALDILLQKNENGEHIKTNVAKRYEEKFAEIAIDEYQDSNLVQEYILTSISNGKNIFMVGDVKQSIYRFRQARPELFLDKYEKYGIEKNSYGQKIKLFKNFRSRENILDVTNMIFQDIMSKDFGEIEYDESEYLNFAASYEQPIEDINYAGIAELDLIDLKQDEQENQEDEEENAEEILEKTEIEAKYVAKRIQDLIKLKYQVFDRKKGYRNIEYRDIVILLRATSNVANIFEKELQNLEIPVFSDQSENYLDSIEIQTIINLLKIIDNPYRDIPLVAVMRSFIGDFSDNELIEIRLAQKEGYYFNAIKAYVNSDDSDIELKNKLEKFIQMISNWREQEKYLPLNELIWKIYNETDYYNYVTLMPNGEIRKANLKMLFERAKEYENISFKGLFNFIRYLEKVKNSNSDLSSAKLISENENVVRIMSIHKSKGLEFPVAIISRTDKNFNQRDLSDNILLHQDIGFGPEYINYDRKIQYSTAAKEAIKIKAKDESIAEEMRILYVALTRAKEKLIITGIENDLEKSLEEKKELLKIYEKENGKINHLLLKKYRNYLGWIELVYLNNDGNGAIELNKIHKKDIISEDDDVEKHERTLEADNIDYEKIEKILNWKYEHEEMTRLQSKMSVTKIKELMQNSSEKKKIEIKPKFTVSKEKISGAELGTVIHLVLQRLDLQKEYTLSEIKDFIEGLYSRKIITEQQKNAINPEKIFNILISDFMKKVRSAKKIYKEMPFYTYIDTKEIYNTKESENILVQGIIDLYFIDENDKLILVDYKTDFVQNGEELVEKYRVQLDIYKKALEEALSRKVNEVYIFSICLNKACKIEN